MKRRRAEHRADGGGRQPADPARRRAGAARGADRADRRRAESRCASSITSGRMTRPARGCATPWSRPRERGVQVSLLVDGFGATGAPKASSQPLIEAQAALLPLRAAMGPPLSAAQPPEAGAGRRAPGDHRRLQHLGRLFRHDRGRAPGATSACWSRATSVDCLVRYFEALFAWAETPDASIRRPAAAAQPEQRHATARCTGCSAGRPGGSAPGRARCGAT